ncbi:MAG: hypothetical protein ACOH2N_18925 [Devosia sp.]
MSLPKAWATLCHHCDGIATGTLLEALHQLGALRFMAQTAFAAADLAERFAIRPGYAALTIKLLVSQGLAQRQGAGYGLTPDGQLIANHPDWSAGARERIICALSIMSGGSLGPDRRAEAALETNGMPERFAQQRLGPVCAALWHRLDSINAWHEPDRNLTYQERRILRQAGWYDAGGWSSQGLHAIALASQYAYPLAYLPTYQAVSDILTEGPATETVDRGLDIAFSGQVFSSACRQPVLDAVLRVFDAPLASQPAALVDTGSGDGTVLAELYQAIRANSERGKLLDRYPLPLIGIEYEEVARKATENRLAQLGCPAHAVRGDIGAPGEIAATLLRLGIEPSDALHINKSVLHNRRFRDPESRWRSPQTEAVFCGPTGEAISADQAFGALVELLNAWKPLVARHGMVCIEAHTVDPAKAARHIGQSLITGLDAAHGFSGQLLTEIGVHRAAVAAARLSWRSQVDLGHAMMGEPIMSVDHLVLAQEAP